MFAEIYTLHTIVVEQLYNGKEEQLRKQFGTTCPDILIWRMQSFKFYLRTWDWHHQYPFPCIYLDTSGHMEGACEGPNSMTPCIQKILFSQTLCLYIWRYIVSCMHDLEHLPTNVILSLQMVTLNSEHMVVWGMALITTFHICQSNNMKR